jgi:hypothetical protein
MDSASSSPLSGEKCDYCGDSGQAVYLYNVICSARVAKYGWGQKAWVATRSCTRPRPRHAAPVLALSEGLKSDGR